MWSAMKVGRAHEVKQLLPDNPVLDSGIAFLQRRGMKSTPLEPFNLSNEPTAVADTAGRKN
jgi:hypothetical protein